MERTPRTCAIARPVQRNGKARAGSPPSCETWPWRRWLWKHRRGHSVQLAVTNSVDAAANENGSEADSEDGDVVRLEVPRSAMIALGYDVSPDRAAERVEAEVTLGPDGQARAVRFLDE